MLYGPMLGKDLDMQHRGRRARVVIDGAMSEGIIDFSFRQIGDEPEENVWLLTTDDGEEAIYEADTVEFLD